MSRKFYYSNKRLKIASTLRNELSVLTFSEHAKWIFIAKGNVREKTRATQFEGEKRFRADNGTVHVKIIKHCFDRTSNYRKTFSEQWSSTGLKAADVPASLDDRSDGQQIQDPGRLTLGPRKYKSWDKVASFHRESVNKTQCKWMTIRENVPPSLPWVPRYNIERKNGYSPAVRTLLSDSTWILKTWLEFWDFQTCNIILSCDHLLYNELYLPLNFQLFLLLYSIVFLNLNITN